MAHILQISLLFISYMAFLFLSIFLENSSYKVNDDVHPSPANKCEAGNLGSQLENPIGKKKGKLYETRYFIIKSLNHQNLQLSIEKGIWATQVMNEPILDEAFHVRTYLINEIFTSHFQFFIESMCLFHRIPAKLFSYLVSIWVDSSKGMPKWYLLLVGGGTRSGIKEVAKIILGVAVLRSSGCN